MGSDLHMNPPKYNQKAEWEGETLVISGGYDGFYDELWRGTEVEYERVKKLIRVTVPPKPNSPRDIAIKNKDVLNTLFVEAKNAAQKALTGASVEDLQYPIEVSRKMCRAFTKEFSDYYAAGEY